MREPYSAMAGSEACEHLLAAPGAVLSEAERADQSRLVVELLRVQMLLRRNKDCTMGFLSALAPYARVMPGPYQFRNGWPRRFERGNIRH